MVDPITPQAQELSLRDYLIILRRRKAIAIQTFVVVVAVGVVLTLMTAPTFRSSARILVEGKETTLAQYNANDPLSNLFLPPSGHDVDTQIEVLQSPTVLADAYKVAQVSGNTVTVEVQQVGTTDVIQIDVTSHVASNAENLAKAIPDVYLKYVSGNRKAEITQALSYARSRLDEENSNLARVEKALERFKKQSGIVDTTAERSQSISAAAVAQANMSTAAADVASARAKLASLQSAEQSLSDTVQTPITTTNNQQIGALQDRIAALSSERKRLLFLYKPGDDEVQKVDLQIQDLQGQLSRVPPTVTTVTETPNPALGSFSEKIADAQSALRAAEANLDTTRARAAQLSAGLGRFNVIEGPQAELQRQLDEYQNLVTTLTKSVQDLSLRVRATHDPVLTVAPAGPAVKVGPVLTRNVMTAVFLGLLLGCSFALLQDYLDDRVSDPDEAKRLLGVPILGHLPLVTSPGASLLHRQPVNSALLESVRVLRSNVQFTLVNGPVKSLLVTSTIPAEGKTSTAVNLAVAMALDGRRIILVDADLHRPKLHKVFEFPQGPGLTDVLAGQASLNQAEHETDIPGLRVFTAGTEAPNPAEILNSAPMAKFLEDMKLQSDMVIIDCSPCLATADSQVLSAKVDGVLYVMQLGEVRKSAVRHAFELLGQAHARVLGTVFNKVDRPDYDPYYGYGYYYKKDADSAATANGHHGTSAGASASGAVPQDIGAGVLTDGPTQHPVSVVSETKKTHVTRKRNRPTPENAGKGKSS